MTTEQRIKRASLLIGGGLLVQLLSLLWIHPLAFVAFILFGCPLLILGLVIYLISLLSSRKG